MSCSNIVICPFDHFSSASSKYHPLTSSSRPSDPLLLSTSCCMFYCSLPNSQVQNIELVMTPHGELISLKKIIRIRVNKCGLDIGRKLISSYSWVWLVLPEGISWWFQITIPSGQVKEVQLGEISSIVILPVLFQILGFRFIKELKQAYKNISRCIVISLI